MEHGSSLNSEMFLCMRIPSGECEKCSLWPNPEMLIQWVLGGPGGQINSTQVFRWRRSAAHPWRNALSACWGRSPVFFVIPLLDGGMLCSLRLRTQQGSGPRVASTGVDPGWVQPEAMRFGRLSQRKRILCWVRGSAMTSYK